MRPTTTAAALIGTALFAIVATVAAQDQPAPASASTSATSTDRPSRGSTMESVKAKFGAPTQEDAAVGRPPITRWEYPGYVVYFENDKVLHTVIAK